MHVYVPLDSWEVELTSHSLYCIYSTAFLPWSLFLLSLSMPVSPSPLSTLQLESPTLLTPSYHTHTHTDTHSPAVIPDGVTNGMLKGDRWGRRRRPLLLWASDGGAAAFETVHKYHYYPLRLKYNGNVRPRLYRLLERVWGPTTTYWPCITSQVKFQGLYDV